MTVEKVLAFVNSIYAHIYERGLPLRMNDWDVEIANETAKYIFYYHPELHHYLKHEIKFSTDRGFFLDESKLKCLLSADDLEFADEMEEPYVKEV